MADPWDPLYARADRDVAKYRAAFLEAMGTVRSAVDVARLERALAEEDVGAALAAFPLELFGAAYLGAAGDAGVVPLLAGIAADCIPLAAASLEAELAAAALDTVVPGGLGLSFDLLNERAVEWARAYAAAEVQALNRASVAGIRAAIVEGIEAGIHPRRTAHRLLPHLGLTEQQTGVLRKYEAALRADGTPPAKLASAVERRQKQLLRARAETVARTETLSAANNGQQLLWEEAVERQLIDAAVARRVWIAAYDACAICQSMHLTTVGIFDTFELKRSNGDDFASTMVPPAHPRCRCAVGLQPFGE